jgi:hypothetical protein
MLEAQSPEMSSLQNSSDLLPHIVLGKLSFMRFLTCQCVSSDLPVCRFRLHNVCFYFQDNTTCSLSLLGHHNHSYVDLGVILSTQSILVDSPLVEDSFNPN